MKNNIEQENIEELDQEIVIDFRTVDKAVAAQIKDSLDDPDAEIIESSAFSGTEVVTVILPIVVPSAILLLEKAINFYLKYRETVSKTTIKVGKDEVTLSGYTEAEIKDLLEGDTLLKLKHLAKS